MRYRIAVAVLLAVAAAACKPPLVPLAEHERAFDRFNACPLATSAIGGTLSYDRVSHALGRSMTRDGVTDASWRVYLQSPSGYAVRYRATRRGAAWDYHQLALEMNGRFLDVLACNWDPRKAP